MEVCIIRTHGNRVISIHDPGNEGLVDGNPRAARLYSSVIILVAMLGIIRQLNHWQFGAPDLTWLSITALVVTPFAARYQVTVSASRPDLRLGLLPALLFSANPALDSTILPIWALLVAAGYAFAQREGISVGLLTAFQIISGSALLAVSRHIDFGFRPYDRTFLALAAYFLVLALLERVRRFIAEPVGSRRVRIRWTWCSLTMFGVYYASAVVAVLRRIDRGMGVPVQATVFVTLVGALLLIAGLLLRQIELVRSLKSLAAGATEMPWARDQISGNLERWMAAGLRARHIDTEVAPDALPVTGLSASLSDGKFVVASRDRGDLPFSEINRETFAGLASMAAVSLHRADQQEYLEQQLQTDSLTRLATYSHFRDRLDLLNVERDPGEKLGLIFLDLDEFRAANDFFGHTGGDRIIREIGMRLRALDDSALIARHAGDEFAFALRHVEDLAGLQRKAAHIVRVIGEPIQLESGVARMQTSVGVALSTGVEPSVDAWVREADRQLYRRKRSLHSNDADPEVNLDDVVRRAIIEQRIRTAFQPVVDPELGKIVMVEALVRLNDPEFGPIAPETLVAIAIRLSLLDEMTRQLAVQTFATIAAAEQLGIKLEGVTINLELVQLDAWSPLLDDLVAHASGSTVHLMLEISERSFITWNDGRRRVIERLAAAGIGMAIDDFGVGYASLGALHAAPVTLIKIDKSLVDDIGRARQQTVLAGMLSLLEELHFDVIVEGIETPETAEILRSMGVRWVQGWLFGKPLLQQDFLDRLAAHGVAAVID